MRYLIFGVMLWCCCITADAQKFHSACRLILDTHDEQHQFSGVAVPDNYILTVAHAIHGVDDIVWAEFPADAHGSPVRLKIRVVVVKTDKRADLCLLRYTPPVWARIKPCNLSKVTQTPKRVRIQGYVLDVAMQAEADVIRYGDTFRGTDTPLDLIGARAIQGMSGSPVTVNDELVGIQEGGDNVSTHIITLPAIQKFLP